MQEKLWLERANDHTLRNAHIITWMHYNDNLQHDAHVQTWVHSYNDDLEACLREYDGKAKDLLVDLSEIEALLRS